MAHVLHDNRVKFPKSFFSILCTNKAALTSGQVLGGKSSTKSNIVALPKGPDKGTCFSLLIMADFLFGICFR